MKTGYIMIDFDVIFPIQSSEFIKSLSFESNLEKLQEKTGFFFFGTSQN